MQVILISFFYMRSYYSKFNLLFSQLTMLFITFSVRWMNFTLLDTAEAREVSGDLDYEDCVYDDKKKIVGNRGTWTAKQEGKDKPKTGDISK